MKKITLLITFNLLLLSVGMVKAQDSLWTKEYQFNAYNQNDLRNSSFNAISVNRMLLDAYRKGVKLKLDNKFGNISYNAFTFATIYLSMIWSHEFGHSFRADQVGGKFKIHNAKLPIPYTTMHLPSDINYVDEALSVTGGFEVNHLTVRKIQSQFLSQNGIFNEDLAFAFANRMMYTIYTSLIVRTDPEEKDVWINTAGDPVHCVLPVFKNYSNNKVFLADSTVNPELVKFYNQSAIFGILFNLLDPQFYSETGAAFGDGEKIRHPKFLIGNHENGWTYGTLFNVSPLGYELYMNNYLHLKGYQFTLYAKYGDPFKNNGVGVKWGNTLDMPKLKCALGVEAWDQDIFGKGMSGELEASYTILNKIDLNLTMGYKSKGYVLGKQINSGETIGIGITYYAKY